MALILTGNSSTLTVDSTSGITFPNATVQAVAAQTGPAFSASLPTDQSITTGVSTLVQLGTEQFDTASCFNNTGSTVGGIPAYAFLPNVAGYYQVNGTMRTSGTVSAWWSEVYKNGSVYARFSEGSISGQTNTGSIIVYLNGTTDYIQLYGTVNGSGLAFATASNFAYAPKMSASLVRVA